MMSVALLAANMVSSPAATYLEPENGRRDHSSNATSPGNVVVVDFQRKVVRETSAAAIAWRQIAADRLDGLRAYESDWDGRHSLPISRDALARGGRLLALAFENLPHPAPPSAVPCADGSLQLEWWLTDTRFELSIEADGITYAWAHNRSTGEEIEAEGPDATNLFFDWARRLTADKLVGPA